MKCLMELANDRPRLSKRDLETIDRSHNNDRLILKKVGLDGMEKMERWGVP